MFDIVRKLLHISVRCVAKNLICLRVPIKRVPGNTNLNHLKIVMEGCFRSNEHLEHCDYVKEVNV